MLKILSIFGTRPEAIKVIPVLRELSENREKIESVVCVTGQHREMLDQVINLFGIEVHHDINIMKQRQSLVDVTSKTLIEIDRIIKIVKPDWILVQGDTTSAMAASIAGFYNKVRIGHIEAGLRTYNKYSPFPEEINRKIITATSDFHFAPTKISKEALIRENIPENNIIVTGNTAIDALLWMCRVQSSNPPKLPAFLKNIKNKIILVTCHRRESFGYHLEQICFAIRNIAELSDELTIIFPVHMNPQVKKQVYCILDSHRKIWLTEPLSYDCFVWLMAKAYFILTDSGGIQEEAPSLNKPVVVMRNETERIEGVKNGNAILVGFNRNKILAVAEKLLNDKKYYDEIANLGNPYGDGNAAKRIVGFVLRHGKIK